ncbi:unnamed protein product, partial [Adineta steineri]
MGGKTHPIPSRGKETSSHPIPWDMSTKKVVPSHPMGWDPMGSHGTSHPMRIPVRDTCYPDEIRKQIENLIAHIKEDTQQEQLKHILWKYGKLFDTSQPSKIDIVLKNAIDTGTHRPVHTPPYRKSTKDQEVLTNETQKLLKNDLIEHSTSPWSSPVVLVKKKDGTTRFCVDY